MDSGVKPFILTPLTIGALAIVGPIIIAGWLAHSYMDTNYVRAIDFEKHQRLIDEKMLNLNNRIDQGFCKISLLSLKSQVRDIDSEMFRLKVSPSSQDVEVRVSRLMSDKEVILRQIQGKPCNG